MTQPVDAATLDRLRAAAQQDPRSPAAHRRLGQALRRLGLDQQAAEAEMAAIRATAFDPAMVAIAQALLANDLPAAEQGLRARLSQQPLDVAAIRMMAELAGRLGRFPDAENLLRRALELAPGFTAARGNLATVLYKQKRFAEAAEVLDAVLAADPANPANQNLKAAALSHTGDYHEALALYAELLESFPDHAKLWMSRAHILKTVGRQDEAVAAYRRALAIEPGLGEVWWSLANLKTVRFEDADVAVMERALEDDSLGHEDRFHLHFALGKALEERREAEASFRHYAKGNALRSEELAYDPAETTALVDATIAGFTADFAASLAGHGCPAPDPVFILGLPRAGSTLIEQILASHSQVEGTMELPDIPAMAMREADKAGAKWRHWPDALRAVDPARMAELGAEFLDRTRVQRKTDKPFYIDKLPNNWAYAGFIAAILPNAKIIDARRHPLDCCFSNFKQHFARGQGFSYSLDHIGRYYADYVRAMDHYDAVLPGRVLRVVHEELLHDPEGQVRRLLDYVGVPFEPECLEFHRNTRAVRTASSEQVRRPINRDGVGQWQPYAEWLGPLFAVLGDLPETYHRRS
ncbi:sulfotransferase [Altererythrobacter sp. H2]|uniref:tetratricopeptide repeat-containing sulfotransferase family protein n=1 Tax=Altererythrobacter sp. H2 TaxID=3108391 RepID=UPI002B4BF461|nr:sulfotransferase [Altererythrobacter sp. H2]WRK95485.1 sulfotransferase [Altererythrobacter sp. H2]